MLNFKRVTEVLISKRNPTDVQHAGYCCLIVHQPWSVQDRVEVWFPAFVLVHVLEIHRIRLAEAFCGSSWLAGEVQVTNNTIIPVQRSKKNFAGYERPGKCWKFCQKVLWMSYSTVLEFCMVFFTVENLFNVGLATKICQFRLRTERSQLFKSFTNSIWPAKQSNYLYINLFFYTLMLQVTSSN